MWWIVNSLMTAQQCAKLANVSDYAIRKALKEGRLKGSKLGHAWLIRKREIYRYMKNRPYQRGRKSKGGQDA